MQNYIQRFFDGRMDLDTSYYLLSKTDYVDALNITFSSNVSSFDIGKTNLPSNRKVSYSLPAGTNKCIGAKENRLRNTCIYFVWNSNGNHSVLQYNKGPRTITKVIESKTDSGGVDILGFSENNKINSIDIINRDEGDLVSWTDGVTSPKEINLTTFIAGTYGVLDVSFIEAAKRPPLTVPDVAYGNDSTRNNNSTRKRLFKFKYRWVYDNFHRSTWSPISDVVTPSDIFGTDKDLDGTKNNYIAVSVDTGNKNVLYVEIAAQKSELVVWGDFEQVALLNKASLGTGDNSVYVFNFYNDGVYPPLDLQESNLTHDWFPQLADSQCHVNGNARVYGGITEGYDEINQNNLSVVLTVANVKNLGVDVGPASLSYIVSVPGVSTTIWRFTVNGRVPTGTSYSVTIRLSGGAVITLCTYTSLVGNTTTDVAAALYASTNVTYQSNYFGSNYFDIQVPTGSSVLNIVVVEGVGGTEISSISTWNYNSKYRLGLVYFDEQGRTNGVVSFVSQSGGDSDFEINTPNFSINAGVPETPVVSAEINHSPPSWAVKYIWVRTKNLSIQSFLYYVTCDLQSDADYYYFCLENIKYFYNKNNKFIYPQLSVAEGDRIRVLGAASGGVYGSDIYNLDFEILGIVQRDMTGGGTTLGDFVKVKKPVSAPSPAFISRMLVMTYTPAQVANVAEGNLFYEFSKSYDIYTLSSVNYHRGESQDQTGSQPAKFEFISGDVYYRSRSIYGDLEIATPVTSNFLLMDASYNDFWKSAVNGNGRPHEINVNAKRQYFPTLVRFSQEYLQSTSVNQINRFYFDNLDEYDRSFGPIRRIHFKDNYMAVFQRNKIGSVPVELQILKTATGESQVTVTDKLLNKINYYLGEFGIGDAPESLQVYNYSYYGADTTRGVIWRLSRNGIEPLSITYKINSWAIDKLPLRTGNSKCYGGFDPATNNYILAIEASGVDPATTISFSEDRNAFESFLSYQPEMIATVGTQFITFKDGELWTHDDTTYNNFYGVQYGHHITGIFNDAPTFKKTFTANSHVANMTWPATEIITSLNQPSSLLKTDYRQKEDGYWSSFLRDASSPKGLLSGDTLKGNWIKCKFAVASADAAVLSNLISCSVAFIQSNENNI